MTLTELQEVLVIFAGAVIFTISMLWAVIRIHNMRVRKRLRAIKHGSLPASKTPPMPAVKPRRDKEAAMLTKDKSKDYKRGFEAGIIEERSKMYSRCYPEIAAFLDREGIDSPDELAEYVCQIIKGFTADEMEDMVGRDLWKEADE